MSDYILRRVNLSATNPTYGMLLYKDKPICLTLERPWLNNQHDVSCIPAGTYPCILHDTADKPHCWEITGVPDRQAILIHAGNTIADTQGCVLAGMEILSPGIGYSQDAMTILRKSLPSNFTLEVINP